MSVEKLHILIVDDEDAILQLAKYEFEEEVDANMLDISYCSSGAEALNILSSHEGRNIRLVISDIRMPEMDGIEFLKNVRREYPGLALCFWSANSPVTYEKQMMELKILDFFEKPLDHSKIRKFINKEFKMNILSS